jgi:cytochrome oxidase Cu insertion factor (SCO1/SenC/PrrC family)
MNQTGRSVSWSLWIGVALVTAMLALGLVLVKLKAMSSASGTALPVISRVPAFNLTNQLGQPVTLENLLGHVWVADIIFTRCAGPCPVMTRQMRQLQDALPATSITKLVSLSTDADYDTPTILQKYAEKAGSDAQRWSFLTGDKRAIANLAIDGLKLTAVEKKPEERTDPADLFIHSTIFVIVDKQGQLRGSFQTGGELIDWAESKQQILAAIKKLESEP